MEGNYAFIRYDPFARTRSTLTKNIWFLELWVRDTKFLKYFLKINQQESSELVEAARKRLAYRIDY